MGENSTVKRKKISTEQTRNYLTALKKVFLLQSQKGSWGRGDIENKVTYTSQAIQLMQTLGISHEEKSFKRAVRWLEDHVKNGEPHWPTRVEIGLKIGDFQKLNDDQYIDRFVDDLEYDLEHPEEVPRLDLFWDVIPTLIELHPHEKNYKRRIPHKKVVDRIIKDSEDFGNTITVQFQANHTGLAALYLKTIKDEAEGKEYEEKSYKMIKWILANREENANKISWQRSRGITSYVLIDLLKCDMEGEIEKNIPKVVNYISPNTKGNVKKDNETTFGTKLHADPLYVSILVLRAMTEVLKMEDVSQLRDVQKEISNLSWFEALCARVTRFVYYRKKKVPVVICFLLSVVGIIFYFYKHEFLASLFVTIGASCAATLFFQWLEKKM